MTRNVQEVLGVGEKLDQVSQMSSRLTSDTCIYVDKASDLNRQALIKKWAPVAIVLGVSTYSGGQVVKFHATSIWVATRSKNRDFIVNLLTRTPTDRGNAFMTVIIYTIVICVFYY